LWAWIFKAKLGEKWLQNQVKASDFGCTDVSIIACGTEMEAMDGHTIFNIWSALKKYRVLPLNIDSCTVVPLDVDSNWFLVCLFSFWISIYCTSILMCRLLNKWPTDYNVFVERVQKGYKTHNPSMWRRVNSFQSFFVESDIVLYWGPEWPRIHQMHQSIKTCCEFNWLNETSFKKFIPSPPTT
jgi:hypothetical protein